MDDEHKKSSVGRGRPPAHTRFKPGKSGNPSGRPKGHRDLKKVLEEVLFEPIPIKGKRNKIPAALAIMTQVRNKALKGDPAAITVMKQLIQAVGMPETPASENANESYRK